MISIFVVLADYFAQVWYLRIKIIVDSRKDFVNRLKLSFFFARKFDEFDICKWEEFWKKILVIVMLMCDQN